MRVCWARYPASMQILSPVMIEQLCSNLRGLCEGTSLDPVYHCIAILKSKLLIMGDIASFDHEKFWGFHSLLHPLAHAIHLINLFNRGEVELKTSAATQRLAEKVQVDIVVDSMTCLTAIWTNAEEARLQQWTGSMSAQDLARFVEDTLTVCLEGLRIKVYSDSWVVMQMNLFSMMTKVLKLFVQPLQDKLRAAAQFEMGLSCWQKWFELAFALLKSKYVGCECVRPGNSRTGHDTPENDEDIPVYYRLRPYISPLLGT